MDNLLVEMKKALDEGLKDFRLPMDRDGGEGEEPPAEGPPEISLMTAPERGVDRVVIPYIVLQPLNGKDERNENGFMESIVNVRLLITTYDPDLHEGRMRLLQLIEKIRWIFERRGVIGGCYEVVWPFEFLIYPQDHEWYHMAEMSTNWRIPPVERDVPGLLPGPWG